MYSNTPLPLSRGEVDVPEILRCALDDTRTWGSVFLQGADAKGASVAITADLSAPRSLAREHYEGVWPFKVPHPEALPLLLPFPSDT